MLRSAGAVLFGESSTTLPDLFREGSGVVAEGRLDPNGLFVADHILAKHDERYMPPQMADEAARK